MFFQGNYSLITNSSYFFTSCVKESREREKKNICRHIHRVVIKNQNLYFSAVCHQRQQQQYNVCVICSHAE